MAINNLNNEPTIFNRRVVEIVWIRRNYSGEYYYSLEHLKNESFYFNLDLPSINIMIVLYSFLYELIYFFLSLTFVSFPRYPI